MTLGSRLKRFIEKHYTSQKDFASQLSIDCTLISRYINEKVIPGVEILMKFTSAGISSDWLISGIGSMYAKNTVGMDLSEKYQNDIETEDNKPFYRIVLWIKENYGSLENFSLIMNINRNELFSTLYDKLVPDLSFIDMLRSSGCNTNWLITGEGSQYANNPIGEILQSKKFAKLLQGNLSPVAEQKKKESEKLFSLEDVVNIFRLAIRIDTNEISENKVEAKHAKQK